MQKKQNKNHTKLSNQRKINLEIPPLQVSIVIKTRKLCLKGLQQEILRRTPETHENFLDCKKKKKKR